MALGFQKFAAPPSCLYKAGEESAEVKTLLAWATLPSNVTGMWQAGEHGAEMQTVSGASMIRRCRVPSVIQAWRRHGKPDHGLVGLRGKTENNFKWGGARRANVLSRHTLRSKEVNAHNVWRDEEGEGQWEGGEEQLQSLAGEKIN